MRIVSADGSVKICDRDNCSLCTTCQFGEDFKNKHMKEEVEAKKCPQSCKDCQFCSMSNLHKGGSTTYTDYKCNFTGVSRAVMISDIQRDKDIPRWCPIDHSEQPRVKYSEMTYTEKQRCWESIPAIVKWDEIKEGEVYHVPPFLNEKRQDILITQKSSYSITYKKLNELNNRVLYTIYPSSLMSRFLVPHMVKEVKLATV